MQWRNGQTSAENTLKMLSADMFGVHIEMPKKVASGFGQAHAQSPRKVCLKGFGTPHNQKTRKVLLKGFQGGARSKLS